MIYIACAPTYTHAHMRTHMHARVHAATDVRSADAVVPTAAAPWVSGHTTVMVGVLVLDIACQPSATLSLRLKHVSLRLSKRQPRLKAGINEIPEVRKSQP